MLYYLGRERFYHGQWQRAIETLQQYLARPDATWNAERCAAQRHAATCARRLGCDEEALRWLLRACVEGPELREPFLELAELYQELGLWAQGYAAAQDALRITIKASHHFVSNHCWGAWPHDLAAKCAYRMGFQTEAIRQIDEALRHSPDDERLRADARVIAA